MSVKDRSLSLIMTAVMTAAMLLVMPCTGYAEEAGSFDAPETAETAVTVVHTPEELAMESGAADNEAFFSVDVKDGSTVEALATEEISVEAADAINESGRTADKKETVAELLNDSGYYTAEAGSGSKVEVTALFASQRLRLVADRQKTIMAYGAEKAVFSDDYYLLSYESEEATKLAYDALREDYGDDAVLIDIPVRAQAAEYGWGTPYMGMHSEKAAAEAGGEVTVAVCDTGIRKTHVFFKDRTIVGEYNALAGSSKYMGEYSDLDDASDDNGHGTMVSGVIAESTPANVKIMPIKVLDDQGEGYIEDVMNGIKHAAQNGADIINLSLGGPTESDRDFSEYDAKIAGYEALVICASGNECKDMDKAGVNVFPAELDNTVCVGAIDWNDKRRSFSNYGSAVDFAAPGYQIIVAHNSGDRITTTTNGTSFASPYVASAAALIKAGDSSLDKDGIVSALEDISLDLGSPGKDREYGNGMPRFAAGNEIRAGGDLSKLGGLIMNDFKSGKEFTGSAVTQDFTLSNYYIALKEGTDYVVSYSNNIDIGEAEMVIKGINDYSGSVTVYFDITPRKITPVLELSQTRFVYDGNEKTPEVTVKDGSKVLTEGTDYTLTYQSGRRDAGTYAVKAELKGEYEGQGTASFSIDKAAAPLDISTRTAKVKYKKLRKRKQTVLSASLMTVNGAKGSVTYRLKSVSGKKYKKYFKINAATGDVRIKKKLKKGTYTLTVEVSSSGDGNYSGDTKRVKLRIRVK